MDTRVISYLALGAVAACSTTPSDAILTEREAEFYRDSARWSGPGALERQEILPALKEGSDLDTYVRFGLLNNAGLRASFDRWRAALERIPQVTALPDPRFGYGHFVEEIQTRTGPQRNRFSLSQSFPWFGKLRLRGDVAAKAAESLWFQVQTKRLAVVREIKRTWYEYGFLARTVRIAGDNLRLLQQLEPIVQRKVRAGGPQEDLLRLQVEIGKVENNLETLRKFRPTLSSRLDAALNRKGHDLLPWPDLSEPSILELSADELAKRLVQSNPELESLRQDIEKARKRSELADLDRWPDLTLGVDYLDTGGRANTPGGGDDPLAVGLMFNLPIWRGKYEASSRQARRLQEAAGGMLRQRQNTLRADLELAYYKLDDGARQIALFRDTLLPRARQSFTVTQTSYSAGTATILEVIDSQRVLLAFENSYWHGISNYGQSLADLEAICGGEIR